MERYITYPSYRTYADHAVQEEGTTTWEAPWIHTHTDELHPQNSWKTRLQSAHLKVRHLELTVTQLPVETSSGKMLSESMWIEIAKEVRGPTKRDELSMPEVVPKVVMCPREKGGKKGNNRWRRRWSRRQQPTTRRTFSEPWSSTALSPTATIKSSPRWSLTLLLRHVGKAKAGFTKVDVPSRTWQSSEESNSPSVQRPDSFQDVWSEIRECPVSRTHNKERRRRN